MKSAAVKVTRGTRKAPRNKKSNNEPFGNGHARFTNFSRNARSNNGLMSPGAPMTALGLLTRNRTIPGPRGLLTINPEVLPFNVPVTVLNNSSNNLSSPSSRNVRTLRHRLPSGEQIVILDLPSEEEQEQYEERGADSNEENEENEEEGEDAPNLLYECAGLALIVGGLYYGFQVLSAQQTTM
jgi:hypothetical protein